MTPHATNTALRDKALTNTASYPGKGGDPDKSSDSNKNRLRLWIRMLRISRQVEAVLRERLRTEFDSTLPRFDVMAALARNPDGMLMSGLSRFLLVSNGNITGIVDRLVADGLVLRALRDGDRRTSMVRLTAAGTILFQRMAAAHERWIGECLASLDEADAGAAAAILASFRSGVAP